MTAGATVPICNACKYNGSNNLYTTIWKPLFIAASSVFFAGIERSITDHPTGNEGGMGFMLGGVIAAGTLYALENFTLKYLPDRKCEHNLATSEHSQIREPQRNKGAGSRTNEEILSATSTASRDMCSTTEYQLRLLFRISEKLTPLIKNTNGIAEILKGSGHQKKHDSKASIFAKELNDKNELFIKCKADNNKQWNPNLFKKIFDNNTPETFLCRLKEIDNELKEFQSTVDLTESLDNMSGLCWEAFDDIKEDIPAIMKTL